MNRQEQIAELKAQIAELEEAERAEREAEEKKMSEERDREYNAIKNAIEAFNTKHGTHYELYEWKYNTYDSDPLALSNFFNML